MNHSVQIRQAIVYFGLGLVASVGVYAVGKKWVALRAASPSGFQPTPVPLVNSTLHSVSTGSETLKVPALTRQPVAHLPALKRSVHLGVDAGRPLVGQIKLASDWELNEKAPSWMALFEKRSGDQGEPHRGDAPSVGKAVASFVQIQEFPVQLGPPSVASACGGEAVICSASELTTLSFPMMPLAEGKQYLLQGTIYMCKRGNHATCSLMSYQCELDPRKSFELAEGQATFQIE